MKTEFQTENENRSDRAAQLPAMLALSSVISELVHVWGFKRIHGRIWTYLYLARDPKDASDLVKALDISKALVSITLRELIESTIVFPAGKSPKGTQLYRANHDFQAIASNVLRLREKRLFAQLKEAHAALSLAPAAEKAEHAISEENLAQLGVMIEKGSELVEQQLEKWQPSGPPAETSAEVDDTENEPEAISH